MDSGFRIGVVAASSVVPMVELSSGLTRMREAGLHVQVHPRVGDHDFTFAGTDEQRALAFFEYAQDPAISVLWCARGGYGAQRILPLLEEMTIKQGPPPPKLLVGYSDVTVLHEFVRARWDWSTLHAPMPAASSFGTIGPDAWCAILAYVTRPKPTARPSASLAASLGSCSSSTPLSALTWITDPPSVPIEAELVGGNLTLWCTLAGTPHQPCANGKILFFEDIGEPFYRLDRMMTQMVQAGMLDGAAAIVLGDFTNCSDEAQACWANPDGTEQRPLRKVYDEAEGFEKIFGTIGRNLGIAVAKGLPVGHGPNFNPLPLGARYRLWPEGRLELLHWSWPGPS